MISNNYIPEKVNDYNVYQDGNKMIGLAAEVELPSHFICVCFSTMYIRYPCLMLSKSPLISNSNTQSLLKHLSLACPSA